MVSAKCEDERQIIMVVPTHIPDVKIVPADQLVSFSSSQTSRVNFEKVEVDIKWLLVGSARNVMGRRIGG